MNSSARFQNQHNRCLIHFVQLEKQRLGVQLVNVVDSGIEQFAFQLVYYGVQVKACEVLFGQSLHHTLGLELHAHYK